MLITLHCRICHYLYGTGYVTPSIFLMQMCLIQSICPLTQQDALKAVINGKAIALAEYNIRVRSVRQEFQLPSVIALTEYHKVPAGLPPLSRRNIYIRDGFRCQYCTITLPPDELTLDHVIPRAKGGKLTWTNTVSCCRSCNVKKSDHLPEDLPRLGMRLRSVPRAPTHHELQMKSRALRTFQIHPHWEDYL